MGVTSPYAKVHYRAVLWITDHYTVLMEQNFLWITTRLTAARQRSDQYGAPLWTIFGGVSSVQTSIWSPMIVDHRFDRRWSLRPWIIDSIASTFVWSSTFDHRFDRRWSTCDHWFDRRWSLRPLKIDIRSSISIVDGSFDSSVGHAPLHACYTVLLIASLYCFPPHQKILYKFLAFVFAPTIE